MLRQPGNKYDLANVEQEQQYHEYAKYYVHRFVCEHSYKLRNSVPF